MMRMPTVVKNKVWALTSSVVTEYRDHWKSTGNVTPSLAVALADAWLESPQWMERPSGPGLWLCRPAENATFKQDVVCSLNQHDIDRGSPFHTRAVYGPIPAEPLPVQSAAEVTAEPKE
jgi:hypothetical protein